MWRWAWALVVSGLSAQAAVAHAQPIAPIDAVLSVEPDRNGCITERSLSTRVRRWLKPGSLQAAITVVVHAASEPISFAVERGGGAVAERVFDRLPAACEDRLDAVALAVALAIEHVSGDAAADDGKDTTPHPGAATASVAARDTSTPVPAKVPEAATAASEEPKPVPPSAPQALPKIATTAAPRAEAEDATPSSMAGAPRAWRLQAGAAYLLGALPDPAAVISAGAERALSRHFDFGFAALVAPGSQTTLNAGSAQTQLYGARALLCADSLAGALSLEGCAGGVGGLALATGKSFANNPTAGMAWLAGLLRLGVRFPAESLVSARIAVDGLGNFVRPKLRVEGLTPLTATGKAFGAAGSIELLVALP